MKHRNESPSPSAPAAPSDQPWRSLEHLAQASSYRRFADAEFPEAAAPPTEASAGGVGRRAFMKLMGAGAALGLGACVKQPDELILPYVREPEHMVPGRPRFYATALERFGAGVGVLVESHMGRPTRIDGNALHPSSQGGIDAVTQAAILDLYDPDRSQAVRHRGRIDTWGNFLAQVQPVLEHARERRGRGLRVLCGPSASPTLAAQLSELTTRFPEARWHLWDPDPRDHVWSGTARLFGEPVEPLYDLARADVVLVLDGDPLMHGPDAIRLARELSSRRRTGPDARPDPMRLYALESSPTVTGGAADHRQRIKSSAVPLWTRSLAASLGLPGAAVAGAAPGDEAWMKAVAADLQNHRGACLVIPGEAQPPEVHVLAHAINAALGNIGTTVRYVSPVGLRPPEGSHLASLADDMARGRVELLVVLGANPLYDAPADVDMLGAMERVALRVHHGLYHDETARQCHWHLPATHPFEAWSDARALDGTYSVVQPLIAPLYAGRSRHEIVSILADSPDKKSHVIVRDRWGARWDDEATAETRWRRVLHDGLLEGSASTPRDVRVRAEAVRTAAASVPREVTGLELTLRADPHIGSGERANNGWLQELPRPLSRLTWDNAALLSPATARRLGIGSGDVLELSSGQGRARIAAWVQPGQADDSIRIHTGYGRTHGGQVARGAGVDVRPLRRRATYFVSAVDLSRTGERYPLVSTQDHGAMEGRDLVRVTTVATAASAGSSAAPPVPSHPALSLYPEIERTGPQWGMAIDLSACIGCGACTVACQSENNIATVGKAEVANGREMHWIRVDRYFDGPPDDPSIVVQPVPCMQCENAPCELVCPVNATNHSPDGLNQMIYNRCVGTRYCSNNCPYKVRRFNFHLYSDWETESLVPMRNPDVTVRSRGVMEKCTYCVQRINAARIEAKKGGRAMRDGEVITACQSACPTRAITFGNVADPDSEVSRLKRSPLDYSLLAEVNARPRTTYLARVTNPNPDLLPPENAPLAPQTDPEKGT